MVTGFIYDHTPSSQHVTVTPVEDILNDNEFHDFLNVPNVKLIVLLCHIPTDGAEIDKIYKFLHEKKPNVPIVFLTGHSHEIRNRTLLENVSICMESGCYGQNIGVLETVLHGDKANFTINPVKWANSTLTDFTGASAQDLNAELGQQINKASQDKFVELKLDTVVGCAPHNYNDSLPPVPVEGRWVYSHSSQKHFSSNNDTGDWNRSIFTIVIDEAYPLHGPFRKRLERVDNISSLFFIGVHSLRCLLLKLVNLICFTFIIFFNYFFLQFSSSI